MKIADIRGYEILTTAGTSTVYVELFLEDDDGVFGYPGAASQGTSKSVFEPHYDGSIEPTDDIEKTLMLTPNQDKINQAIFEIKKAIIGKDITAEEVDKILCEVDGTENKQRLGSSLILAISIAACRAESSEIAVPLHNFIQEKLTVQDKFQFPIALINVINGGVHASSPTIAIQEILLVPKLQKDTNPSTVLFDAQCIFFKLQKLLQKKSIFYGFGLEGGISAQWNDISQPIELLLEAIELCRLEKDFSIGFDCAASTWFDKKTSKYRFFEGGKQYSNNQLMDWYKSLINKYPISYVEDPFAEHDYEAWKQFKHTFGKKLHVVGDDLCSTQVKRITTSDINDMIDAVVIKPSQVGTITETIAAINAARSKNLALVISRRSCETADDFIVDLAFSGPCFYKFGNIAQGSIVQHNSMHTFFLRMANFVLIEEGLKKATGIQE